VRIALHLKGLQFEPHYVHLLRDGGENWKPQYRRHNPLGLVPTLIDGDQSFTQSLAIIEYLDECHPDPPLLPDDKRDRAYVRELAQVVVCDIQPLNNLRVLDFLKSEFQVNERQSQNWYRHWVEDGLDAVEALMRSHCKAHTCCYGETPTLADICLVPQVYNALRYDCDLEPFPMVRRIYEYCVTLPAFRAAAPERQGDAV
jgi:maleylacetoacetate isomerase